MTSHGRDALYRQEGKGTILSYGGLSASVLSLGHVAVSDGDTGTAMESALLHAYVLIFWSWSTHHSLSSTALESSLPAPSLVRGCQGLQPDNGEGQASFSRPGVFHSDRREKNLFCRS